MQNILLAVVGLCGTGKSETTDFIAKNYPFHPIYFGGYVINEVKRRNLEVNSQNEKIVREGLRKEFGMDVIARLSFDDIRNLLDTGKNVVIDGLYSFSEYKYLKNNIPHPFFLLAVHSSKKIRYERLWNRKTRPLSPNEVDDRDFLEVNNLEKSQPIALADFHIVNDGLKANLHRKIRSVLQSILEMIDE